MKKTSFIELYFMFVAPALMMLAFVGAMTLITGCGTDSGSSTAETDPNAAETATLEQDLWQGLEYESEDGQICGNGLNFENGMYRDTWYCFNGVNANLEVTEGTYSVADGVLSLERTNASCPDREEFWNEPNYEVVGDLLRLSGNGEVWTFERVEANQLSGIVIRYGCFDDGEFEHNPDY